MSSYEALLEDLRRDHAEALETVRDLQAAIRAVERKIHQAPSPQAEATPPAGPYSQCRTILEAAIKYLKTVDTPQTSQQVKAALLDGGFQSSAKDPYYSIHTALKNGSVDDGPIEKIDGRWRLRGQSRTIAKELELQTLPSQATVTLGGKLNI